METERLTFRHWKEEDAPLLYSYAKDPDIGPLCGWQPHKDEQESLSIIKSVFTPEECWAIVLKETGQPVGTIELKLNTNNTQGDDECEVGCWLGKPYWRKGIMSEATQWVLKRAFEELGMNRIYWAWFEGNTASQKTAEKAGFVPLRKIRNMFVPHLHTSKNSYVAVLTKERYEQLHPSKEEMIKTYEQWEEKLNAYHFAMTLIGIDANDRPPLDGAAVRNRHTSLLASELFRIEKDPWIPVIMERLLKEDDLDPVFRRRLELRFKGIERMKNIPEEAYSAFRKALVEDERSDYDILLDDNEEGWNKERYDAFFEEVKKELVPLIHAISEKEETDDSFLHQTFDVDEQRKLMKEILEYLGFTEKWGKLGESEHPLTTWIAENDVRITTKYREHDAAAGILSTVHETGHAWFVHNVDSKYDGTLIVSGIRSLIYYFSMARHMVGGRTVLYRAVIILDIGLFTTSLTNVPLYFMVLYLAGMHGFAGAIDILRALESRKLQTKSWKLTLSQGIINMGIAGVCLTFIGTMEISVLVYGLGLIYSGVMRVIQAFRKTEVIYIQ